MWETANTELGANTPSVETEYDAPKLGEEPVRTLQECREADGNTLPRLTRRATTLIERAFWFSQKKYDTTGTQGHPRRATGGLLEFVEAGNSYVQNQGGPLTAPDLNTFLREGFTYGNDTKMMFAGGIVLQAINEIARGQILMQPVETTYGMKISTWVTAFGTVNIVHNPLFVEDYASSAFLLDMECFAYRYMNNRDTTLQTNIQAPDADGEVDQYLSECGLQRTHAAKHSMIKGVSS